MTTPRWTFITNHGLVLSYVSHNPSHTAREIAKHVGITERTIHKIIGDLEEAGYIERNRVGRKNIYSVDPSLPLRHHTKREILVEDLPGRHLPRDPSRRSGVRGARSLGYCAWYPSQRPVWAICLFDRVAAPVLESLVPSR